MLSERFQCRQRDKSRVNWIIIVISLCFIHQHNFASSSSNPHFINYHTLTSCPKDAILMNGKPIVDTTAHSTIQCATLCSKQQNCSSFQIRTGLGIDRRQCQCFEVSKAACTELATETGSHYYVRDEIDRDESKDSVDLCPGTVDTCRLAWRKVFQYDANKQEVVLGEDDELKSLLELAPKARILFEDAFGLTTIATSIRYILSDESNDVLFELPKMLSVPTIVSYTILNTSGTLYVISHDAVSGLEILVESRVSFTVYIQVGNCEMNEKPSYMNANSDLGVDSSGGLNILLGEIKMYPALNVKQRESKDFSSVYLTSSMMSLSRRNLVVAQSKAPGIELSFDAVKGVDISKLIPSSYQYARFYSNGTSQMSTISSQTLDATEWLVNGAIGWYPDMCWRELYPHNGSGTNDIVKLDEFAAGENGKVAVTFLKGTATDYHTSYFEANYVICQMAVSCQAYSAAMLSPAFGAMASGQTNSSSSTEEIYTAVNDAIFIMYPHEIIANERLDVFGVQWYVDTRPKELVFNIRTASTSDPDWSRLLAAMAGGSELILVIRRDNENTTEISSSIEIATIRDLMGTIAEVELRTSHHYIAFDPSTGCTGPSMLRRVKLWVSRPNWSLTYSTWNKDFSFQCENEIIYGHDVNAIEVYATLT